MFKYLEFITEHEDKANKGDLQRISGFKDFDNKNFKFVRSLFDEKIDNREVMDHYKNYIQFRNEVGGTQEGSGDAGSGSYLRKEPKYIPLFFRLKTIDGTNDQELRDLYKDIQKHRNTLKQNNIDLLKLKTFEEVQDELTRVQLIEKTNKFVKLLPSTLRTNVKRDKEALTQFSNMLMDYSYEDYKNTFLKKVAKYRTVDELFNALENHLKSFQGISKIFKDIEDHPGAKIVGSSEDYLVARIFSKEASCDLGSQQWCITNRGGSMWKSYIADEKGYYGSKQRPGVQYFIWDFTYKSSDARSLIGATIYNDNTNVSHNKSDGSFSINGQQWEKYLTPFKELDLEDQIRLVANNPTIEGYTGTINRLGEESKRKWLQEIPELLLQFDDLDFLSNQEIWDLVKRNENLAKAEAIAKELTDDQKIYLVVRNPDLLEEKWKTNPYGDITSKLTRKQRIKMISNKHSLYTAFKSLSEDEHFELINLDPKILISHVKMAQTVNKLRLKNEYIANKEKWDRSISSATGEKKTKIELLFSHLTKDENRLDMEDHNNCFIIVAGIEVRDGEEYLIPDENKITYVEDILSPQNQKISAAMLMANFNEDLNGFNAWVPKDLLDLSSLENEEYFFKSEMEDLMNGTATDKTDQAIYDSIIQTKSRL
mgnify:CR=1 FL=1|tara:strand:+ start:7407 stop:9368 length:1962 start_codon:yes stop_codon:yes gene_type:complete